MNACLCVSKRVRHRMYDRGSFEILIVAAGAELVTKGNSIHLLRSLINVNEVSNHQEHCLERQILLAL